MILPHPREDFQPKKAGVCKYLIFGFDKQEASGWWDLRQAGGPPPQTYAAEQK